MPSLISCANGLFSGAATWALVDATSLLDSEAGSTEVATAPAWGRSASFAPGAITVDGIAVKIRSRLAAPAGTISVRLYDVTGGAAVAGTTVTLNVSDLPTCDGTQNEGGWVLFKFVAGVLLLAAGNLYAVDAQESVGADDVFLWRNATASNWSRMLRTTTVQAPVAGDILHVMGEHTAAGAGTNFTVTMDLVAATDFGSGVDGSTALTVCKRGTLNYGFNAATNYYLKLSGNAIIYNGGTFTIGTVGSEIPRDSTAVLEFDPVADGGMGLICRNGSTVTMQGLSRTVGKNFVSCLLNTDEAIGQTELGVDTDTGWLAADVIAIASTTRTYSECESRIIAAGGAAADHIDVTVGLTNAHDGIAPVQAEVILLTRNVKVRSATSTIMSFACFKPTATVDIDWVEFYYLGENAADKRCIDIQTITGSFNMQYCSLYNTEDYGIYPNGATVNNFTLAYNTTWNISTAVNASAILLPNPTSGTAYTIDHNVLVYNTSGSPGMYLADIGGTITNNTIAGASSYGIQIVEAAAFGTFSGNTVHSCSSYGLSFTSAAYGTVSSMTVWRCNNYGLLFGVALDLQLIFSTITLFGNLSYNISGSVGGGWFLFQNGTFNGDSTFDTTYGVYVLAGLYEFENCNFGTAAGILTTHSTADIRCYSNKYVVVQLSNTILASTEVSGQASLHPTSGIYSTKHDQTLGNHRTWKRYGTIQTDAVYFHTAAPSEALIPIDATNKLESGSKKREVDSGNTRTFSVWVRKSSVAAGGFDYAGNEPRLILKKNVAAGIAADTLLDTAAAALNVWEQLSGVTPAVTDDAVLECIVDCDGVGGGFVNTDDWTAV